MTCIAGVSTLRRKNRKHGSMETSFGRATCPHGGTTGLRAGATSPHVGIMMGELSHLLLVGGRLMLGRVV